MKKKIPIKSAVQYSALKTILKILSLGYLNESFSACKHTLICFLVLNIDVERNAN